MNCLIFGLVSISVHDWKKVRQRNMMIVLIRTGVTTSPSERGLLHMIGWSGTKDQSWIGYIVIRSGGIALIRAGLATLICAGDWSGYFSIKSGGVTLILLAWFNYWHGLINNSWTGYISIIIGSLSGFI